MKNILVILALISSTAYGMVDSKHYYWKYKYEGKTFNYVSEDRDWFKSMEAGAQKCMKFFKADPDGDETRYEILTGVCVNPESN